jgi:TorA maturation chaperone TorD
MREIQNVPSRVCTTVLHLLKNLIFLICQVTSHLRNNRLQRDAAPSSSKSEANASDHEQKPKIITKVKRKVDTLRENRDYSNLFSDDADTPAPPAKEQHESKPVVSPKTGAYLLVKLPFFWTINFFVNML